jgi:TolB-like protein
LISWNELKQRRITQVFLTYLALGWIVLEGFDQLADREVIPEIGYRLALLAYLGGIPTTLILGWYHGERGRQRVTLPETMLLALVVVTTASAGVGMVRSYLRAESVLPPGAVGAMYDPRRVAVLYFEDLSGSSRDLGHVADGLTEGLIDELARVRELEVLSRNAVDPYRDATVGPDSVGRALSAGSVIRGSVEPAGDRLRVSVRLVDTESGVDIDRTSFAVPEQEVLAARDSLVLQVARFLRTRLGEEVRIRELRAGTRSADAWTRLQRAERLLKEAQAARAHDVDQAHALLVQSDSLLQVARSLDPQWVEPTVLRAEVALQQGVWAHGIEDALEGVRSAVELASAAIGRDPSHAGAWEVRGTAHEFHWYLNVSNTPEERAALLDAAQRDLERAVEIDPALASALSRLSGIYYYRRGDRIRGALAAQDALRADAYLRDAAGTLDRLFWAHYDLGQFAEAGRTCREAGARFPADVRFKQCALWMMISPTGAPDPDAAWELLEEADSLSSASRRPFSHRMAQMIVAGVLARANLPDSARSVLVDARGGPEVDPNQELPGYEAIMRTILGDQDEAVRQLRRYVSANPGHRFVEVEGDLHWWWRPLRDNPGFREATAR